MTNGNSYVIADYERRNFSVSQCNWDAAATSNIVPILKPVVKTTPDSGSGSSDPANNSASSSSVPVGAIAGGAVGGVAVVALACFLLYWYCIKPRKRRRTEAAAAADATTEPEQRIPSPPNPLFLKPELDSEEVRHAQEMEAHKNQWISEADGGGLGTGSFIYELDGKKGVWAVEADGTPVEVHEMPAVEEVAAELRGDGGSDEIAAVPRWSWEMTDPVVSPGSPPSATVATERPQVSEASPRSLIARMARR